MSGARDLARNEAEVGIAYLARAFNRCDNPELPYVWAPGVLARFEYLAGEIIRLVEDGEIKPRTGAIAQADLGFQKFMSGILPR